jgi:pyruvate/2-oxoglutarate dehydrogenase complex dihydrolipoamide acyltransferase (E2) component
MGGSMRAAALTWIALALAGCEATPGGPAPTPPVAARPAPAPRVAADPEAQRLGLDLGIALITVQCEDASVRRQATRTRDALLERTRLLTQVDRAHGDAVWAEAEAVMAAQRSRPQRTECEAALPTLRNAEQMARSQAR